MGEVCTVIISGRYELTYEKGGDFREDVDDFAGRLTLAGIWCARHDYWGRGEGRRGARRGLELEIALFVIERAGVYVAKEVLQGFLAMG